MSSDLLTPVMGGKIIMKTATIILALTIQVQLLRGVPDILIESVAGTPASPDLEIADGDLSASLDNRTDLDGFCNDQLRRTFRISNTGDQTLTIDINSNSPGTTSTEFTFTDFPSSDFNIAPGGSREFEIQYLPLTSSSSTIIRIDSNDPDSEGTYTFRMRGEGECADIDVVYSNDSGPNVAIQTGDTTPSVFSGTDLGGVPVGRSQGSRFQINNNATSGRLRVHNAHFVGADADQFRATFPNERRIDPGESEIMTIGFNPTSPGVKNAIFVFETNDPNEQPYFFAVRGEGTLEARFTVKGLFGFEDSHIIENGSTTPTERNGTLFPDIAVQAPLGSSGTRGLYFIRSTGSIPLELGTISITGPGAESFRVGDYEGGTLDLDGLEAFHIDFIPEKGGVRTATVSIPSNDADQNPFEFTIRGTGIGPEILISGPTTGGSFRPIDDNAPLPPGTDDGRDFGNRVINQTTTRTFRIINTGNEPLTLSNARIQGTRADRYSLAGLPTDPGQAEVILAPGEAHFFDISFTPQELGPHLASFFVDNNDAFESPYNFVLNGNGVSLPEPEIGVLGFDDQGKDFMIIDGDLIPDQEVTQFGTISPGSQRIRNFRIVNTGDGLLRISSGKSSSDDFTISDLASSVPARGHDDFSIVFRPSQGGEIPTTIDIFSNDPDDGGSYSFALTGNGVIPKSPFSIAQIAINGDDAEFTMLLPDKENFLLFYSQSLNRDWKLVPDIGEIAGSTKPVRLTLEKYATLNGQFPKGAQRLLFRLGKSEK